MWTTHGLAQRSKPVDDTDDNGDDVMVIGLDFGTT